RWAVCHQRRGGRECVPATEITTDRCQLPSRSPLVQRSRSASSDARGRTCALSTRSTCSAGVEAARTVATGGRETRSAMVDPPQAEDDRNRLPTDDDLGRLQWTTICYYLHETNPDNGLVRDKTDPAAPCSIAAVGMALATLPVAVERGVLVRQFAAKIARRSLRYLRDLPQGPERTPPGTRASSTTSSTSRPAAVCGSVSCPRSTRRSYSQACSPPRRISTATRPTRPKSAAWPTRSIAGLTGTGPGTAARRSRTAGGRKAASSRTAGRATTRDCQAKGSRKGSRFDTRRRCGRRVLRGALRS